MMTQLETSIVNTAQGLLAEEVRFYLLLKDRADTEDDQRDYDLARGGLRSLLALAHQADSGLSAAAVEVLRDIEAKETAATNEAREALSSSLLREVSSTAEAKTKPFTKEDMLCELDSTIKDLARQDSTEYRGRYFGESRGILRTLGLLGMLDDVEHAELKVKIDTAHQQAIAECEAAGEPLDPVVAGKEACRWKINESVLARRKAGS